MGEAISYLKNHNMESLGDPKRYVKLDELVTRREEMLTDLAMQISDIQDIWTFGGLEYMIDAMCLAVTILVGLNQSFTIAMTLRAAISIFEMSGMILSMYAESTSHDAKRLG